MKRWIAALIACSAGSAAGQPGAERLAGSLLAVHNRERALVGVPPLAWDARLAADAASYARVLAATGRLEHSSRSARPGQGENLAMGTERSFSPARLAGYWAEEKGAFTAGSFPDVSRTGDWRSVGHYTQMVWRQTDRVGCGVAAGGGTLYLVCRYSPAGNVVGGPVF